MCVCASPAAVKCGEEERVETLQSAHANTAGGEVKGNGARHFMWGHAIQRSSCTEDDDDDAVSCAAQSRKANIECQSGLPSCRLIRVGVFESSGGMRGV